MNQVLDYINKILQEDVYYRDDYDANEFYIEKFNGSVERTLNDVVEGKVKRQPWYPIKLDRIKKIWQDYTRTGTIRDESGVDEISDDIVEIVAALDANTVLGGHTSQDPKSLWEENEIEWTEERDERLTEYLTDETGAWRLSDYGLDKLKDLAIKLMQAKTAEEKVLIIDQILNITHQRSDLAAMIVVGGRNALDELSGNIK
jgi:hypothetical protein